MHRLKFSFVTGILLVAPLSMATRPSITDSLPRKVSSSPSPVPVVGTGDLQNPARSASKSDPSSSLEKSPSGVRATLRDLLQSWLPSGESDEDAGSSETTEAEGGTPEALDGNVVAPTDVLTKEELAHTIPWRPTNFEGQKGALGWSPSTFEISDAFKNRVGFWRDIYSKYSTDQGVIHDTLYINFIYATMDFSAISRDTSKTPAQRARAREAMIKDKKKEVIARIAHLKGHTTADGLNGEDLRFWKLYEKINDPEKFSEAADKGRVRFQLGQRDKFVLGIFYSGRYLRAMEKIFRDEGLPMELTRLPFVESSFNMNARSRVGASGVWQFMRRTAKPFMKVNRDVDERNDPIKATRASAHVLKQNYIMLESWPLALTGYNHGPYGVRGIVSKTHTRDLAEIISKYSSRTFGFASENFYACFLAALEVERHAHKYFGDVKWSREIENVEIKVSNNTPYRTLVDLFSGDTVLTELLNPQFSSRVRSGRTPIPKGSIVHVAPAVADLAAQAMSGKIGGTRLAVAVKAASKNQVPNAVSAPSAVALMSPTATGGMQASVRAKVEQVGQAAAAAMPTLTMTEHAATHELALQNSKTERVLKQEELIAAAPAPNLEARPANAGAVTEATPTIRTADSGPLPNVKGVGKSALEIEAANATGQMVISELKTHRVRRGENLTHIATKYGVDLESLQKINHLDSQRGRHKGQIRVGQILTIPGGTTVVKAGAAPVPSAGGSALFPQAGGSAPAEDANANAKTNRDDEAQKLIDAKALPGATATPGATPRLNSP